ncbi:T9SS type A sorting domain-containing protein [bacterium]|nr:T9SS type A sorting domain-containing protein [bacterium]
MLRTLLFLLTVTVTLYGQLADEPTAQPTNLIFSNIGYTKMTLSFTPSVGGADGYIVLKFKASSPPAGVPEDGQDYGEGFWWVWRQGASTSLNDSNLDIGVTYTYEIFAYNGSGNTINYLTTSPLIGTQATMVDSEAPSIGTVSVNPYPATYPGHVVVTATITDNYSVWTTLLDYRNGTETSFENTVGVWNRTGDLYSFIIPESGVTKQGLFYRIRTSDISGNIESMIGSIPVFFSEGTVSTLSPEGGAYPIGFPSDQWRMFSIPLKLDNGSVSSVLADFGESGNSSWRLFDGSNQVRSTDQFKLGQSFWFKQIIFPAGKQIALGSGRTASVADGIITLRPGWNQIANPFTFSIDWALDTDAGNNVNIKGPIAYDGSKYIGIGQTSGDNTPFTELKPWDGYWVYNAATTYQILTIDPSGAIGAAKSLKPSFVDAEWRVQITVRNGKFEDQFNYVGAAVDATDDDDRYDLPELPTIGDFVSVSFDHKKSGKTVQNTIDYCTIGKEGYSWDMQVASNLSGENVLSWMPDRVPQGFVIRMMNVSRHEMVEGNEYHFRSANIHYPVRFKVWIGTEEYLTKMTTNFENELPNTFELHANYPNPFNPETRIRFDVARSGNVKLKVYNILGQEVIVLVNGYYETGRNYSVNWNGKDQLGLPVASGLYFYRLEAGKIAKTKKMLLVK